jgi:hypothetical protein
MSISSEASKSSTDLSPVIHNKRRLHIPLNQVALKDLFEYNPETGVFRHKHRGPGIRFSQPAGHKKSNGFINIKIQYVTHLAHRMAWVYTYGEDTKDLIVHINGDRADNRIENLKVVTRHQSHCKEPNKKGSSSKYRGVALDNRATEKTKKPWRATIKTSEGTKALGMFATEEEAHAAYCTAADKYHKEYANHG